MLIYKVVLIYKNIYFCKILVSISEILINKF